MFNAYMTDTVILLQKSGDSTWGEQSEVETNVRARVEYGNSLVRNREGEQVVSTARVYMKDRTLSPSARIKIDGVEYPILNVLKKRAFSKHAVLEVHVG